MGLNKKGKKKKIPLKIFFSVSPNMKSSSMGVHRNFEQAIASCRKFLERKLRTGILFHNTFHKCWETEFVNSTCKYTRTEF